MHVHGQMMQLTFAWTKSGQEFLALHCIDGKTNRELRSGHNLLNELSFLCPFLYDL